MMTQIQPKAYSIHIGLNAFDESYYGYAGQLKACERDALAMDNIANQLAYTHRTLILGQEATRNGVKAALEHAQANLIAGDLLLITYSGHGVQEMDFMGVEDDGNNEAWCLYDGLFLDDEIYVALGKLTPGVKVLMISDSCHSGTMSKDDVGEHDERIARSLAKEAKELLIDEKRFQEVKSKLPTSEDQEFPVSVKLLAACQDHELAYEGKEHGEFTTAIIDTWAEGKFGGNYLDFFEAVQEATVKASPGQHPNYYLIGPEDEAFNQQKPFEIGENRSSRNFRTTTFPKYYPFWPHPTRTTNTSFAWHLEDTHTQLRSAQEKVRTERQDLDIRIAIIDTGYRPEHPALPKELLAGKNFTLTEEKNAPIDKKWNLPFEQEGHGTATMAILAGGAITKEESDGYFEGEIGAIPWAKVVPMRISDSVFFLRNLPVSKALAQAIDHAVDQKCEVISISMGGVVSNKVAKAINRAYEAGVTIVAASGNSWHGGLAGLMPKVLLYPARFNRVIAACGATYNHEPYDFQVNTWPKHQADKVSQVMQGNWGPASKMRTALAAYTPNIAWATPDGEKAFRHTGGGTSSVTPQIAAAAAMWLVYHRQFLKEKGYAGTWKQVEAVRHALFQSANKEYGESEKYYGNGILRAMNALDIVPKDQDLKRAKKDSILFPWLTAIFAGRDQIPGEEDEQLMAELLTLIYKDPDLMHLAEKDLEDIEELTGEDLNIIEIAEKILEKGIGSEALRSRLSLILED